MVFVAIGNRFDTNSPLTDCDGKDAAAWNEEAFSLMLLGAEFSGEGGMGRVDLGGQ